MIKGYVDDTGKEVIFDSTSDGLTAEQRHQTELAREKRQGINGPFTRQEKWRLSPAGRLLARVAQLPGPISIPVLWIWFSVNDGWCYVKLSAKLLRKRATYGDGSRPWPE